MKTKTRIALFASGTGSNVLNIISHFSSSESIEVAIVLSNKSTAGALTHARNAGIKSACFNREDFFESNNILNLLKSEKIDYVILAGFLWKVPAIILTSFENRVINVHPSLLPNYGGKGMYGHHVHNAVLANNEKETGITIHLVNEKYDDGAIITQAKCSIEEGENLTSLQQKISQLEKEFFPITIEQFITKNGFRIRF
jgi:phosphoribosylglycinamide formyltransferase-1